MRKFQVITNEDSENCELLKSWLKQHRAKFDEWHIEDSEVKNRLLDDDKFNQRFCDIVGCAASTPVIHVEDTGEYYYENLFNIDGLVDEDTVKDIIGMA
ncbi:MAG TPA: hypothetical protein VKM55_25905 [Candidatus Lokiarchaeia archaeon]|nr:hypothetical protein [Candidatus Lokiarchaeia archaeon]